ncbi:MAG: hypothetical protein LUI09_06665, partial [Prevotellaceae bacterium]|nr:hypothetical protein [Prevotellaceae bacterium]
MKEGFANLVNGKSQEVDLIIDSMFHSKKNEARRFLMFVNGIIDYYLHRKCDEEEGVCFPVVYLPNVPDWGREVLLKFLILKLSLFYNVQKREQLARRRGEVRLVNEEQNVHYKRYEGPFRRYIRPILKQLPQTYIGKDGHKNIIVCREQDLMTSRMDKNMFIKEFYGPVDDICSDDNLAICHDITAKDIREKLHSLKEDDKPKIDNIFIFYTNNEQCNSYNDAAIKRINVGVRNCFIFYFSSDPFRLYHTRKRKISLGGKFPMLPEKEALANEHFITLTEEESRYLFNLTTECCHCHIPDDQLFFHDQIETLFENSDHPILDRTHLTLCLDEVQRAEYIKLLKKLYPHYP